MAEDEAASRAHYREMFLQGEAPDKFLVARVEELKATYEKMKAAGNPEAEAGPGAGDFAYVAQFYIDQGILTEPDVVAAVPQLGLAPEEAAVFMTDTMPGIREFMKEQKQQELEVAKRKQDELATQYCQDWGLERLDGVANHFQSKVNRLTSVNQYWGDSIKKYQTQRQKLEQELAQVEEPTLKAKRLMRELHGLTFFQPSEATAVFNQEREFGSRVYVDSLLDAFLVMQKTSTGVDPDSDDAHLNLGSIGMTVSYYMAGDPTSERRRAREGAIENLVYGAQKPNETRAPWKKQIRPIDTHRRTESVHPGK